MARKRPKGVVGVGLACLTSTVLGRTEHVPTSEDYPESVVRRTSFTAGGGLGWRISALETPRETPAPWKIVVVTGSPSWAEYWAPVLAALPHDREMIVVDRPGFGASEPADHVPDLEVQALALSPLLNAAPGQKILLVGQSYGAAIATLMARRGSRRLKSLVLLSGYYGEPGPTARWLLDAGAKAMAVIPRDLRHAVLEVSGQPERLAPVRDALRRLNLPIHVIHGDKDDFAPLDAAERLVAETRSRRPMRLATVAGADHFINDGPAEALLATLEECLPRRRPLLPEGFRMPEVVIPDLTRLWASIVPVRAAAVGGEPARVNAGGTG
ncbi:MAG: alpha/beta hydrolase [Phenylobacterium sp.]|uniref:alpha/beta fold hydrolase n=1 Tax=Phenylobacterium sp. TaxID=1871053 RepID=UPI00271964A1|nr:alpha/beta hydrolase [Phenylobacterium sp.]MDO8408446.1 alpha/beta hydrolase [Phenylobacterium sp.]